MELIINNKRKEFLKLPVSLADLLLDEIPNNPKGIAVALNNKVIPKSHWQETLLKSSDSILIITATQGG